jgi:hypothetical protein
MQKLLLFITAFLFLILPLQAQVLGPCGSGGVGQEQPAPTPPELKSTDLSISPVPLPGQSAIDFKLTAVVGDDIKEIKLSDYDGKWRVVCFFPAAFTFV